MPSAWCEAVAAHRRSRKPGALPFLLTRVRSPCHQRVASRKWTAGVLLGWVLRRVPVPPQVCHVLLLAHFSLVRRTTCNRHLARLSVWAQRPVHTLLCALTTKALYHYLSALSGTLKISKWFPRDHPSTELFLSRMLSISSHFLSVSFRYPGGQSHYGRMFEEMRPGRLP